MQSQADYSGLEAVQPTHNWSSTPEVVQPAHNWGSTSEKEVAGYTPAPQPPPPSQFEPAYPGPGQLGPQAEIQPSEGKRICGMRKRVFWILLVLLLLAAIVGGVVGGVLGSKKTTTPHLPNSTPSPPPSTTTTSAPLPDPTAPINGTALTVSTNIQPSEPRYILVYQTNSGVLYYSLSSTANPALQKSAPLGDQFKAKPDTALTALSFTNTTGLYVHVYYFDPTGTLADAVFFDGSWTPGVLSSSVLRPASSSKLASTVWVDAGAVTLWIYFQDDGGYINEWGYSFNSGWAKGSYGSEVDLRVSMGSPLALSYDIAQHTYQQLKIYAQVPDGSIVSRDYTELGGARWSSYYPIYAASGKISDISVVTLRNSSMAATVTRVMFVLDHLLQELTWKNETGWAKVPVYVVEDSNGALAATQTPAGGTIVYFQPTNETSIREARLGGDARWTVTGSRTG